MRGGEYERDMRILRRLLGPAICWLIALAISVPLLAVLWSVTEDSEGVWGHLAETVLDGYIRNTVILAIGVSVSTLIIGVSTAWLVTSYDFPGARIFRWALLLPLAIPTYLTAYALTDLFEFSGPVQSWLRELMNWEAQDYWFPDLRSLSGAVSILSLGLYPYVFIAARTGFSSQSASMLDSSRLLGAGPWRRFFSVALPMARPSIFAGLALVMMETIAEFGAVDYCAVDTFSTGIYRTWTGRGSLVAASQLSVCLLGVVSLLYLVEFLSRRSARFHHTSQRSESIQPTEIHRKRQWLATLVCTIPIAFGFILPVGRFINLTMEAGDARASELFLELATNSVTLAGIAAACAIVLGLFLAFMRRETKSITTSSAAQVAGFGYAIPGGVIAIGILGPLWWIEDKILTVTEASTDWDLGLFLSGSIVAVLIGYQIRFLAIPLNVISAGFARIRPSIEDAAANLGATRLQRLFRIHIPLLTGSLFAAALIVFVDVLKELPATLILRPFDFETLAVRVYQLASDERLSEASTGALAIIAAGLVPVILLTRLSTASQVGTKQ